MIIHLLSSPRNVSTALMYAFAQRADTKVMDEPFYGYYLCKHGVGHPGKAEIINAMECTFDGIIRQINELQSRHSHVFIKNMAHHLIETPLDFLRSYKNILFIRHPKEIITSFAKVIPAPTMQDIGVQQQSVLFDELNRSCVHAPLVIDSAELIKNPEALLKKLCESLEIPFSKQMLSWETGGIPEDGIWAKYWYENVHNSTGFQTPRKKEEPLPPHCTVLLEEALPFYHALSRHTIKI